MSKTSHPFKNTISRLIFPLPTWRYFILFQSWSQFKSWVMAMAGFSLIFWLMLNFLDPDTVPIAGILVGGGIGSMFSVILVIPAQFTIFNTRRDSLDFLIKQIEYFGYIKESTKENCVTFRQNLPRLLRWNEGNVIIWSESGIIRVAGAMFILKSIRKKFIEYNRQLPD